MTTLTKPDLKKKLRLDALARRDALAVDYRLDAAMSLVEWAAEICSTPPDVAAGFWPIRSEMDVRPLMHALGAQGARLALPAILDSQTIVFRELIRGAKLVEMGFGTKGPDVEAQVLMPDLILVPLAAFDARGHRIGYGGGFYDRALARMAAQGHMPKLVGIAFDCQEVDEVPDEPHDVVLPEILTESGLRRFAPDL
ncbi:5-formyltetrahydrofolate cyclo-ligase [Nitratireductor basaltis]|uniref:5-formyltetrahydrofolate cyclo-ligase n=1 Tax=Nitratireductor basaltis TaxID=472175 RepID=A0A084U768_9HYPH|nr:5-formyltetrahydrofolate cyclo-ligase [Nitratireductor basaltis]KFB08804.1 5,10-methenyltetrahydrofolate synthetase [Nitratireductor basaltis]